MPLTKLQIQAGIFKDDTVYSQENRYVDANKIRFMKGRPEKIGGWAKLDTDTITSGVARTILPFRGQVANNKRVKRHQLHVGRCNYIKRCRVTIWHSSVRRL